MDNKSTTKRMIGAVVLVLIAALLLAWLLKGKNQSVQQQQELIADQTNQGGSTPILGFPGVQEGGEVAQEGDAPYVIGGADAQQQDGTTAEQEAPVTDQQQVADAGKADDATGTGVGAAVGGAAAGAVTAGKEAVQTLANNFQVRDSDEQRQVVADGKAKAGTGSMGSSELALPKKGEIAAAATNAAAATEGDANQQQVKTAEKAADATKAPAAPAKQAQSAAASESAAQDKQAAESQKAAANVKLVGEKTVPAPRSQSSNTASASSSSGSRPAATTSASSSRSSAVSSGSQSAAGGKGYAIQVLAASSLNKAEQVRKSISVDGYPVFVVKANVNGKTVYRVRVGTYPARNAASAVQTKMKARYTKNQYVQNSFVTKN